jgi:hypothetical protein
VLGGAVAHDGFHAAGVWCESKLKVGPGIGERPMISASGAYSRLLRPAPIGLGQEQIPQTSVFASSGHGFG